MSLVDDIDMLRTYISWINPIIGQDEWRQMNYEEKINS